MVKRARDIDRDPGCIRATDPDVARSHSLGSDDNTDQGGSLSHPALYDSAAIGAIDVGSELSHSRVTDPDIVPSSSLGPPHVAILMSKGCFPGHHDPGFLSEF